MKRRPFRSRARGSIAIVVVATALLAVAIANGEILPTEGTFRGIYHQNRAGVGHFKFFILSVELTKQLAPFNGKYIELEVLDGIQPINPGPAFITKIGRITELPPPPLQVDVKTISPGSGGPETFDVVYSFTNTGQTEIVLDANDVAIGLEGYKDIERPDEVDRFYGGGYTRKQRAYGGMKVQPWNWIHPMSPGVRTHFYTRRIKLPPGELAPFVWHSVEASAGEHEVVVSAWLPSGKDERIPISLRKSVNLPLKRTDPAKGHALTVHTKVARDAEWLTIEGRLSNETEMEKHIFVQPDREWFFLPGLVQLEGADAKPLSIDLDWTEPYSGPWVRKAIEKEGLPFRFRVRQSDHFKISKEKCLRFWTLTDEGIEKLTLADDLPAPPAIPETPWGKVDNGCRLRIRMAKVRFADDEQPRFFFEVDTDRTTADILWINRGDSNILVDGKPAKLYTTQLIDSHVLGLPRQGEVKFAQNHGLTEGKHNLKVTVQGRGGEYANLNDDKFRKFDGTLISNEVEFSMEK